MEQLDSPISKGKKNGISPFQRGGRQSKAPQTKCDGHTSSSSDLGPKWTPAHPSLVLSSSHHLSPWVTALRLEELWARGSEPGQRLHQACPEALPHSQPLPGAGTCCGAEALTADPSLRPQSPRVKPPADTTPACGLPGWAGWPRSLLGLGRRMGQDPGPWADPTNVPVTCCWAVRESEAWSVASNGR